jgi:hypothetical protein
MENAINKIVSDKALGEVERLIVVLDSAEKRLDSVIQTAGEFNKALSVPPKSSDALNKQLAESDRLIKQLQTDYKAHEATIASLQKKIEQLSATKKTATATDRQTIIDNREIRKELDGQAIANSNLTSYIQKLSVERAKASRIVADYNAQVAMGTALTEQQSAELAQATASFQKYDNAIKAGKKSIGDAREYVGQYERANLGLINSVNQIVREVPSATFGIQTFFLAISNNVPIMVDEVNKAVEANKALKANGEQTVSVWKQVGDAIFSFNTLLNVGLLVLALYGKEIGNFFSELVQGTKSLNDGTKALLDFQNAQTKGMENTKNELQIYREYVKIAGDKTLGYHKQKIAIDYLKDTYPGLLKSLSEEQMMKLKGSELDKKIESTLGYRERYKANLQEIESINKKIEVYKAEIKARVTYTNELKNAEKERYDASNSAKEIYDAIEKIKLLKEQEKIRKESVKDEIIAGASTGQLQQSLIALQEIYSSSLKQSQILKEKSILLEEKDTNLTDDNTRAIKLNTKAREDYLASEYELWKIRKTNESNRNKEIMNDEASGYELRLMASEQYYQNQLDLANREAQEELRVLEFSFTEQQRIAENEYINYQDSLNKKLADDKTSASQRALILKELSEISKQYDKDKTAMVKDNVNKQNIIYENQAQKLINANRELIGEMERAWNEINFGKADILIDERSLKSFEDLGKLLKGIGNDMPIGEIKTKLAELARIQDEHNREIKRAELQVNLDRIEAEKRRVEKSIESDGILNNLSKEQVANQKINNKVLIDLDKQIIKSKEDIAKADNETTQIEIENALKVKEAKLHSVVELVSSVKDLTNQLFENQISDYDRQIEKSNEYYDTLISNAEKGSEQEKLLQEEKAKREEVLQKRKIELQRKQAMFNKLLTIGEITLNLMQEISKNNAQLGTVLAQPINALAIASSAVRVATVMATPLPQYKDGRGKGKDEYAIVGDGGRSEVIERGNGKFEITPNTPTLTHLNKDDIVHKSLDDFNKSRVSIQNASIMASFGNQHRQLQMFDYYLSRELNGMSSKIEKGIEKGFKKAKINNYVNMPKIDIGHLHYKNKGFNA